MSLYVRIDHHLILTRSTYIAIVPSSQCLRADSSDCVGQWRNWSCTGRGDMCAGTTTNSYFVWLISNRVSFFMLENISALCDVRGWSIEIWKKWSLWIKGWLHYRYLVQVIFSQICNHQFRQVRLTRLFVKGFDVAHCAWACGSKCYSFQC